MIYVGLISGFVPLPKVIAAEAVSLQAFEQDYPEEDKTVLDNKKINRLGLTYTQLKGRTQGWSALSKALYGTERFGEYLKQLNGGAESPMDVMNWVQTVFCALSEKYCAPVVKIRARSLKFAGAQTQAEASQPAAVKKGTRPSVASSAPVERKIKGAKGRFTIYPASAKSGEEYVVLTIVLPENLKAEKAPSVKISDESGVNLDVGRIEVSSDRSYFNVPADLLDAKPGKYSISISVGDKVAGKVFFQVLPKKELPQEKEE